MLRRTSLTPVGCIAVVVLLFLVPTSYSGQIAHPPAPRILAGTGGPRAGGMGASTPDCFHAAEFVGACRERPHSPPRSVDGRSSRVESASPVVSNGSWINISAGSNYTIGESYGFTTYDAADGAVLLFGGVSPSGGFYTRTYEFKDGAWEWIDQSGVHPTGREYAGFAYDPADGYAVLFGGYSTTYLNDTWIFRNDIWSQLNTSGAPAPGPREASAMGWDAADDSIVLFSGWGPNTGYNDTWTFRAGHWTEVSELGRAVPPYRFGAQMAFDAFDAYLLLFGGSTGTGDHWDTWSYRGGAWSRVNVSASHPSGRSTFALDDDEADGYILLFGGVNGTTNLGDTWAFKSGGWTQLTPLTNSPGDRLAMAAAYDPAEGYFVISGGYGSGNTLTDTWVYRGHSGGKWSPALNQPAIGPTARSGEVMAYDPALGGVVVGEGMNLSGALADFWLYRDGAWSVLPDPDGTLPPARSGAVLVYDESGSGLVLFGGTAPSGGRLNDTWVYSNGNWSQRSINPAPSARSESAATYDPAEGAVILFGGRAGNGSWLGDTWRFSDGNWSLLSNVTGSPPPRILGGMTFDEGLHAAVLYGGEAPNGSALSDMWEFNGSTWTGVPSLGPAPSWGSGFAYDGADGGVILVGGTNGTRVFDSTWGLRDSAWVNLTTATGTGPGSTAIGSLSFDAADGALVDFGGLGDGITVSNTTTELSGAFGVAAQLNRSFVVVGQSLEIAAARFGGVPPFRTVWSGLPTGCDAGNVTRFSCAPTFSGNFSINVTFTDGLGRIATSTTLLDVLSGSVLAAKILAGPRTEIDTAVTEKLTAEVEGGTPPYTTSWYVNGLLFLANGSTFPFESSTAGDFNVSVHVSDKTGQFAVASPVEFEVVADPRVAISVDALAKDLRQSFNFTATESGGVGPFAFNWSFGDGPDETGSPVASHAYRAIGTFAVSVLVADSLNLTDRSTPVNVTVVPDLSLGPLSLSNDSPEVGQLLVANISATGGVGADQFAWSGFPSGTCVGATSDRLTCQFVAPGVYSLSVVGTDAADYRQTSAPVNLTVGAGPSISVVATATHVSVGSTVTLTARIVGGSTPYIVAWVVNGTVQSQFSGLSIAFHPTGPGNYTFGASVSDAYRQFAQSGPVTVTVAPAPNPGSGGSSPDGPLSLNLGNPLLWAVVAAGVVAVVVVLRRVGSGRSQPRFDRPDEAADEEDFAPQVDGPGSEYDSNGE